MVPYQVNGFFQLGINDPYPEDIVSLKGSRGDNDPYLLGLFEDDSALVYNSDRYVLDCSPLMIYVPRKEVMFKMMRACVKVDRPDELWFNRSNNKW